MILQADCDGGVNKIFSSTANRNYLVGYSSGKLEMRKSTDLTVIKTYTNLGDIGDCVTDD